jgi:hypothetical protein
MRHIEAIEAILNGRSSGAAGATGTSGSTANASTIDSKQISEIKMHLAELRKALNANDGR